MTKLNPRMQEMETAQLAGWRIKGFQSDGWATEYVLGNIHAWRRPRGQWRTAQLDKSLGLFQNHRTHETMAEALAWRP